MTQADFVHRYGPPGIDAVLRQSFWRGWRWGVGTSIGLALCGLFALGW